ncbi:MAG: hypothetical protein ABIW93_00190 [Verrucomicrobiota bacterium]
MFIVSSIFSAAVLLKVTDVRAADQVLLFDNFDSYADSIAFSNVWNEVLASKITGTLTSATNVSAPNSVSYDTTGTNRNGRSFTETGLPAATNAITFSFDFYDSNAALSPYRQFVNLQDGASPGVSVQLIAMGLNNNLSSTAEGGNYYMARLLGLAGNTGGTVSAFFKLNDAAAPLRSTGWHNLKVVITDTEFKFYVDSILSKTVPNTGTLRSYDVVRLGSGLSSVAVANFDNVLVSIPGIAGPSLGIALLSNNEVVISWPTNATDFVLETNSNLNTTNWVAVTNVPVVVNDQNTVTNSITNSTGFYRLKKAE